METNWNGITSIADEKVFEELQKKLHIPISDTFIEFIKTHNNGHTHPYPYVYSSRLTKGAIFLKVLSFNREDESNVWDAIAELNKFGYVVFMPFGMGMNGFFGVRNNKVYFHDTKANDCYVVADDLVSFLENILSVEL